MCVIAMSVMPVKSDQYVLCRAIGFLEYKLLDHPLYTNHYCMHGLELYGCIGKTGLIAYDSRFGFSPQTQSYMNTLSNFTVKVTQA